jgi:CPA2 family monovalent cation:H+ antiporter-2
MGWDLTARVVLGFALALGSTAVIVKSLSERGEVHTQHAKVVVGINVVQDLAAVALVGLLPILGLLAGSQLTTVRIAGDLGLLGAKTAMFIGVILLLARTAVPRVLRRVARSGSQELFLATVVVLCLAGASVAQALGFSLALGAFLAGMMVSESEFRHETFAHVAPLRDLFGLLFFVSLGMLLNPAVVLLDPRPVLLIAAAVVIGKSLLVCAIVLFAGYHLRTAIMSGLALGQIGEFSFVIIQIALQRGHIPQERYSAIIAAAVISIALTPVLLRLGRPLYDRAARLRPLQGLTRAAREKAPLALAREQRDYVLLCGYGRVGRVVSDVLSDFEVRMLVIDYDQDTVERLRREGVVVLYGDAANPLLLDQAGVKDAKVAVVALPESRDALLALKHLNQVSPEMPKIARGVIQWDLDRCYEFGAEEVAVPEVECGLELARHTLMRLGFDSVQVQQHIDNARLTRYRCGVRGHVALKPPAAVDRDWNRLERRTLTKVMAWSDRRRSRILIESHHCPHVKWHRNTGLAAQAVLCAPFRGGDDTTGAWEQGARTRDHPHSGSNSRTSSTSGDGLFLSAISSGPGTHLRPLDSPHDGQRYEAPVVADRWRTPDQSIAVGHFEGPPSDLSPRPTVGLTRSRWMG